MNCNLKKYQQRSSGKHFLEKEPSRLFRNAIVIPAFNESRYLPLTLKSISENPNCDLEETMVIAVINNPPAASADGRAAFEDNQLLLSMLREGKIDGAGNLNLFWIDASSQGREIDSKAGVGSARKIGMDTALRYLDMSAGADSLIISLDADTLVEGNYISAIRNYFSINTDAAAASIRFKHQIADDHLINSAITDYELFIRYYLHGIQIAGSPYAYQVLGSAMAFRPDAYVRAGGMRARNGGEDFYFLEAVRKTTSRIGFVSSTCVHPSPRASTRVPFGTGPKINSLMSEEKSMTIYNPSIFKLLREIVSSPKVLTMPMAEDWIEELPNECRTYLVENEFLDNWSRILQNTPDSKLKIEWAFHVWFDALKTLKFVHFCENRFQEQYPQTGILPAYNELFSYDPKLANMKIPSKKMELLELIRDMDGKTQYI